MLNDSKFERIKTKVLALGPIVPGTLRKVYLRCGKKNCRCRTSRKSHWHGPYFFWDRKEGKKLSSRSIPSELVRLIREWIDNRRELDQIISRMLKQGMKIATDQLKSSK